MRWQIVFILYSNEQHKGIVVNHAMANKGSNAVIPKIFWLEDCTNRLHPGLHQLFFC